MGAPKGTGWFLVLLGLASAVVGMVFHDKLPQAGPSLLFGE